MSASIEADTSPVYAPCVLALTSCAPNRRSQATQCSTNSPRYGSGGRITRSTPRGDGTAAMASTSRCANARSPCSFQFPATILRRIGISLSARLFQLDLAQALFEIALGGDRFGVTARIVRGDRGRQHVDQEIRVRM